MINNQYELEQCAIEIATNAQNEFLKFNMDVYDYMHQVCDGHEDVIYTYKAIQLCANCDTENGEEQLQEIGYEAATFNEYASKLAYATLFDACVLAFDNLEGNLCDEEIK